MKYYTTVQLNELFNGIWTFEYFRDYQLSIHQKKGQLDINLFDHTWDEDCHVEVILLQPYRIDFWAYCSYGIIEFSVCLSDNVDELMLICNEDNIYYRVEDTERPLASTNHPYIFSDNSKIRPFKDTWYEEFHSEDGEYPDWCFGEWVPIDGVGHLSMKKKCEKIMLLAWRFDLSSTTRAWIDAVGRVNEWNINFTAYSKVKSSLVTKSRPIQCRVTFAPTQDRIIFETSSTAIAHRCK